MSPQFLRFLLTGGVAALVNLSSRYVLNWAMPFEAAVAVAYLFGMLTAYILSRTFVFGMSGRSVQSEFGRFVTVNAFALVLVWGCSVGLARFAFPALGFTWYAEDVAHLIGVLAPALTSYLGHKHFTFSPPK